MENYKYKVSVIIPVYNAEKELSSCCDSLLQQSFDKTKMEVLLINDGSTDNSLSVCRDYEKAFSFFKVFSQENKGVSCARNEGIKRAEGQYLLFLDGDDTLLPNTIEEVISFFDKNYERTDIVTYPLYYVRKGIPKCDHFRYKVLNKTGIYSIMIHK